MTITHIALTTLLELTVSIPADTVSRSATSETTGAVERVTPVSLRLPAPPPAWPSTDPVAHPAHLAPLPTQTTRPRPVAKTSFELGWLGKSEATGCSVVRTGEIHPVVGRLGHPPPPSSLFSLCVPLGTAVKGR